MSRPPFESTIGQPGSRYEDIPLSSGRLKYRMAIRSLVAASILGYCLLVPASWAGSVSGLTWQDPAGWKVEGERPMRAATYTIPPAAGDSEPGECVVYYFGPGQGGGVEANIQRWIAQFEAPGGGPADKLAQRSEKAVGGLKVTLLDLTGTYLFKPFPMAPQAQKKPGFRMMAAIVPGADAPVFFKLTAPAKTAAQAEAAFQAMIASLAKK